MRYGVLAHDAWLRRARALRRIVDIRRARAALLAGRTEPGTGARLGAAPRSVLNRPTGPHRQCRATDLNEAAVRAVAHQLGGSVNDVVLVVVVEALRAAAADAGEEIDHLVVSVPVAGRPVGARNAVGVMPIVVPATGALGDRVRAVTEHRKARLVGAHGQSLPLVLLAFQLVRALHLVRWFLERQRLVNTFVTAVPPLPDSISIAGVPVATVVPLVVNQGNTTAAFATARHAGRLAIAVTTDPDAGPDGRILLERLTRALTELTRLAATDTRLGH